MSTRYIKGERFRVSRKLPKGFAVVSPLKMDDSTPEENREAVKAYLEGRNGSREGAAQAPPPPPPRDNPCQCTVYETCAQCRAEERER